MFTYLWRLVLICGPFPVVLRELLLDTGTTRISVGVYLKKPEVNSSSITVSIFREYGHDHGIHVGFCVFCHSMLIFSFY